MNANLTQTIKNKVKKNSDINIIILIAMAVAVLVLFGLSMGGDFFSASNFESIMYQVPEFGFLALAMALCMLSGGIDLSVVSTATVSSVVAASLLTSMVDAGVAVELSIAATIVLALVIATICGLINGLLIAKAGIVPILATLTTMILYSGIALAYTDGAGITGFPDEFLAIGYNTIIGVPGIFWVFLIVAVIIGMILARTYFGKSLYLYGENKTASLFAGINNDSLILKTYTLAGLLCGIAAIIIMSRVNSARVGYGETYQLQAILVCVLGGVDPNGGKGKILGVILGIVLLQFLQSGFTLLGFAPYVKKLIWGSVLILVMIVNYYIARSRSRGPVTHVRAVRQN